MFSHSNNIWNYIMERDYLQHRFAKKRQFFLNEREYQALNELISLHETNHRQTLRKKGFATRFFNDAMRKFKNAGYI